MALGFGAFGIALGCGGSSNNHAQMDAPFNFDANTVCGTGDDCNIAANTGCDVDDRCTLVQDLGSCWFPACELDGPGQLGDACAVTDNNDGAENWDNCTISLVCYNNICTQACGDGGPACKGSAQCVEDPDVGGLVLDICI